MKPLIVGISGGTGSGKSTVTRRLAEALPRETVSFVAMDSYYRDLSDLPIDSRRRRNFDHPDAFDLELLAEHIDLLRRGEAIEMPVYDFRQHVRSTATETVSPGEIVVVDGILLFHLPRMRTLCDLKVYVDADADIRLSRRIRRDMAERGRQLDDILDQYETTVRPMHDRYVAPTKECADLIIPHGGQNDVAIEVLLSYLQRRLEGVTS
jgi:uridine kinase